MEKIRNWIYRLAVKIIMRRIVRNGSILTPKYLLDKGWIKEGNCYVEANIKDRDKIWINIDDYYYRVFHGKDRTFIALESTVEWFDLHYLMAHGDNGRYELAGV